MRITDLLQPQSVELHVTPADKAAAIHHLTTLMAAFFTIQIRVNLMFPGEMTEVI